MIAWFRCGNEERENEFWREDWERMFGICGEEREHRTLVIKSGVKKKR